MSTSGSLESDRVAAPETSGVAGTRLGSSDVSIDLQEAVQLSAIDTDFYGRFFFPQTIRQKSPDFHALMDAKLEGPSRKVSFMVFRDGAKTTKLRIFLSKRIAYAVSRTILIVGKSQDHSRRTVEWLMSKVEYNRLWASMFNLRKGKKWTSEEIEIFHGTDDVPIRIIALGITGSTRGINVDDYRPDLIVIDDPCDEENTATPEQRQKTEDLLLGSLVNSLAPASEFPNAKIVLLQTLLHPDDVISKCTIDPSWDSLRVSVFREDGTSAWPDRYPTKELLAEKEGYIQRGKLPLWMREKECKIVAGELSVFRMDLMQYYETLPPEEEMTVFVSCDPVPPPSESAIAKGLVGNDFEAWAAVGVWRDPYTNIKKIFVLETSLMKGHDPDWSVMKFFEFLDRWHPIKVKVESVAYQRTLKWLLEKAMLRRRKFVAIDAHVPERRKKTYRIIDSLGTALADKQLYVHPSQNTLIEAIQDYPNVSHDDEIEAVSVAVQEAIMWEGATASSDILENERNIPDLEYDGACP